MLPLHRSSKPHVADLGHVVGSTGQDSDRHAGQPGIRGVVLDAEAIPFVDITAVRMLDEGYASVADIDTALQFGLGYPAGPFAMIDAIGADEVLAVCEELASGSSGLPRESVEASPLLVEHVLLDRPFNSA